MTFLLPILEKNPPNQETCHHLQRTMRALIDRRLRATRKGDRLIGVECRPDGILGERTHPNTGREVVYVQCKYVKGVPIVKDNEELDHVEWMTPLEISTVVTSDIFPPVKQFIEHLAS